MKTVLDYYGNTIKVGDIVKLALGDDHGLTLYEVMRINKNNASLKELDVPLSTKPFILTQPGLLHLYSVWERDFMPDLRR